MFSKRNQRVGFMRRKTNPTEIKPSFHFGRGGFSFLSSVEVCYRIGVSFIRTFFYLLGLHLWVGLSLLAAESYELLDGNVITGPPVSFTKDGVAFREPSGDQGPRLGFTNFTQQALQELSKNPKGKRHVEPFLEAPIDASSVKGRPAYELKSYPKLKRPDPQGGLGKLMASGLGVVMVLFLVIANLYSAYEIGIFRNYSPFMVLGISVILPVITQIVFLCLPTHVPKASEHVVDATGAHVPGFSAPGSNQAANQAAAAAASAAGGHGPAEAAALPRYKRGEFTFNKRFFETKMSGFFGVRPSDVEKGLVFSVKTNKAQLPCNRVVRVTPAEVCLQVLRTNTIEELNVPFADIVEIEIKHRA